MSQVALSSRTDIQKDFLSTAMLCNTMAVDTETNGQDIRDGRGYCVGISAAVKFQGKYHSAYFPVAHYEDNVQPDIKELLFHITSTRERIVFHNAKFDIVSLKTAGHSGKFIRYYCTMLMAHMLNENVPKGLDWLAKNELKEPGKVQADFKNIWKMGLGHMIPVAEMERYAGTDAVLALKLFEKLHPLFVKSGFDGSDSNM